MTNVKKWLKDQIDSLEDICSHHKILMDEQSTTREDVINKPDHKYYTCYICDDPRNLKEQCKDYRSPAYYEKRKMLKNETKKL